MSHIPQQHVAAQSPQPQCVENRRTALLCCFPLALTATFVTLEYALQTVILYVEDAPRRLLYQAIHLWLLVSFQPLAPQTSDVFFRSCFIGLLLLVLLGILGGSSYMMLSVAEDIIRVLAPPRFVTKYMPRCFFPRKVFFRLSLPVGVPSLEDMLSPHASSQTIPFAPVALKDEAACEDLHPTPLKRVYISLVNTFTLQLEKANTMLITVTITNRRWIAMIARLATERQGMESHKLSADVSPANSKNPQRWYYKNKDRFNTFFKAFARKEGIAEFDALQERRGLWYLFDASIPVVIDLDEFERRCEYILHTSIQNESGRDALIKAGHELIHFYGRGYLPDLIDDEGFEEWGEKAREKHQEMFLKALLHIAKGIDTAARQCQEEQQPVYLQETAQFYLEYAITASHTLSGAERRGEPALQKCLEWYIRADDIPAAKNAFHRYEQHINDHLCDVWEPSRKTQKVWRSVLEK